MERTNCLARVRTETKKYYQQGLMFYQINTLYLYYRYLSHIVKVINKILYKEIRPSFWKILWVTVLMLLVVSFDIIAPWPFKILIDNVLGSSPIESDSFLFFLHKSFNSRDLLGFFAVFVYFSSTFALNIAEYMRSM